MKNKKLIYSIISLVLVLALTINIFTITGKTADNSQIDTIVLEKINTHIASTLPGYLKMNNLYGLGVTTSEPIIINNWNSECLDYESYLCFIFNNGEIIGKLTISEYNGEIISSFDIGEFEEINEAYNLDIPVAFGSYKDCLIMQKDSESIILYGLKNEILNELLLQSNTKLISEVDTKTFRATPATRNTIIQLKCSIY